MIFAACFLMINKRERIHIINKDLERAWVVLFLNFYKSNKSLNPGVFLWFIHTCRWRCWAGGFEVREVTLWPPLRAQESSLSQGYEPQPPPHNSRGRVKRQVSQRRGGLITKTPSVYSKWFLNSLHFVWIPKYLSVYNMIYIHLSLIKNFKLSGFIYD